MSWRRDYSVQQGRHPVGQPHRVEPGEARILGHPGENRSRHEAVRDDGEGLVLGEAGGLGEAEHLADVARSSSS